MKFDITLISDGRPKQFGNCYKIDIEEAIEELMYYHAIQSKFSEDELRLRLMSIKDGDYILLGTQWEEYKITKVA